MPISISVPDDLDFKPRITVVGVGGGGCNAVDHMIKSKLEGVSFVACNTDLQALRRSTCPVRVRLGLNSTQGLGAGSNPVTGQEAAEESLDEVLDAVGDTHMLFVVAGFGGGTGTGALPVIAKAAHERGILTVAVVTTPFTFEAVHRTEIAQAGLEELRKSVDTFVVIANQKLFDLQTDGMSLLDSFRLVDNVLYDGVRGITDLLMCPGLINLDFADVRSTMKDAGAALMGTGEASGENKIEEATQAAINNPLLSYQGLEMDQATSLLVNITSSANVSLSETEQIMEIIRDRTHERVNLKVGVAIDDDMGDTIRVSVVMAGLDREHASVLGAKVIGRPGVPRRGAEKLFEEPMQTPRKPNGHGFPESAELLRSQAEDMSDAPLSEPVNPPPAQPMPEGTTTVREAESPQTTRTAPSDGPAAHEPDAPEGVENGLWHADNVSPTHAARANGSMTRDASELSVRPFAPQVDDGSRSEQAADRNSEAFGDVGTSGDTDEGALPMHAASEWDLPEGNPGITSAPSPAIPENDQPVATDKELRARPLGAPSAPTAPRPLAENGAASADASEKGAEAGPRPAVHTTSEEDRRSGSWANKLFGLVPGRRKSGQDRREPSFQFTPPHAGRGQGKAPSLDRQPARGLAGGPALDATSGGAAWRGTEPASARAVLGIDPRQIPSFRK